MTALRYDTGDLSSPIRLDNGYLRADARITRVGVFEYHLGNGKTRRELRLPEDVFKSDSLNTFDLVPLTNDHPAEQLTAKNTKKFSVGTVTKVRQDAEFVRADIMITDEDAIAAAEGGKQELSCGYKCDLDMTAGVTSGIQGVPDGLRFDAIQRNIRGNHVAMVDRGRAGRDASMRLDSEDAVLTGEVKPENRTKSGGNMFMKITLDGVDFEVTEQVAQAIAKVTGRADADAKAIAELKSKLDKESARADAMAEKMKAKEEEDEEHEGKKKKDAADALRAAVKARLDLERSALSVLGSEKADELKVDEMDDADLMKAVVLTVSPAAKERLDSCSEDYLAARFDSAVELAAERKDSKRSDSLNRVKKAGNDVSKNDNDDRFDAEAARQRMLKANRERGVAPLRGK